MATINAKIVSIRVYSNGDNIRYRIIFDQTFTGMVKNDDDDYTEEQVDYIDFVPSVLIAQCLDIVEGLSLLYNKKKEQGLRYDGQSGFGAAELQVVLKGAKVTLERNKFEVGDEYQDADGNVHQHEHAGYSTSISDIRVTDKIQDKLDNMIDKMFDI